MSQNTINLIVIIISGIVILPVAFVAMRKYLRKSKERKEALAKIEEKREYYKILTREKMEKCPREDLSSAAVVHVLRKESEDYDNVYDNLNMSEKVVYVIYEIMTSIQKGNDTLRTFFETDFYKPFFPLVDEVFYMVGCREIGDLMKAARRFAEIIENDLDDDENDPELGDYSRYNFADFTNEFRTLAMALKLNDKLTDFIAEHKEDFIDEDVENIEEGENDENISNEI